MLRAFVIGLGLAFLAGATILAVAQPMLWPVSVELGAFGALILIGTLLERHYRWRRTTAGTQWQSTGERFVDPGSGKLVEVRFNPATGERAYIDLEKT